MINDRKVLFSKLKVIWKLWEKETPNDWPSEKDSNWLESDTYEFFKKYSSYIGVDVSDEDNYFFYLNLLILNEDSLENKTLTLDDMVIPKKQKLSYTSEFIARGTIYEERKSNYVGYLTEDQFRDNFYILYNEDIISPSYGELVSTTYDDIQESEDNLKDVWVDDVLNESKLYDKLKKLPKQNLLEIQKTISKILS